MPRVDLRRGAGASSAALRVDPAMEVLVENGCRLAIVEYLLRVPWESEEAEQSTPTRHEGEV